MITEDKLKSLITRQSNDEIVSTKELKSMGFNGHDIAKLVEESKLCRTSRGKYIVSRDFLLEYTNVTTSITIEDSDLALDIIKKMLEKNPADKDANYKLFFIHILREEYDEAVNHLYSWEKISNVISEEERNVYLCLLSCLTDLPQELIRKIESFIPDDLSLRDRNVPNAELKVQLREEIFYYEFVKVRNLLLELKKVEPLDDVHTLIELLVNKIFERIDKLRESAMQLIVLEKYEESLKLLEKISGIWRLKSSDQRIYALLVEMLKLSKGQNYDINLDYDDPIIDSVKTGNFDKALRLAREFTKVRNKEEVIFLLNKLSELSIKKRETEIKEARESATINLNNCYDFMPILASRNYSFIYASICGYANADTTESRNIALALAGLCTLEDESTNYYMLRYIDALKNRDFVEVIPNFLSFLKSSIKDDEYLEAELYMTLFEEASKIVGITVDLAESKKAIDDLKYRAGCESHSASDIITRIYEKSQVSKRDIRYYVSKSRPIYTKKYVEELLLEVATKKGVKLLDNVSLEEFDAIRSYCSKNQDIVIDYFPGPNAFAVLRYSPIEKPVIAYKSMLHSAQEKLKHGYNEEALTEFQNILIWSYFVTNSTYYGLAEANRRLGNLDEALNYFRIAHARCNEDSKNNRNRYAHIIDSISYQKFLEEKEEREKSRTEEITLRELESIGKSVACGEITFVDAIIKYRLTKEEEDIVNIFMAKAYCYNGEYDKCDSILESVESELDTQTKLLSTVKWLRMNAPKKKKFRPIDKK